MSISARLSLYKSLMCPLYRYGAGIWSLTDHQLKLLERFHLGILKKILGCAKTTTTAAVYSETGMSPILFELDKSFFQFVGRLAVMNPVRLVSKLFLFSAEDDVFTVKGGDRKKSPWRHRLDALINEYNLEESFQNLKSSTISHEMWKSRVKSAVWKARCAHVKSALSSAVKCSHLQFHCEGANPAEYLSLQPAKLASFFFKLRSGSLRLEIEEGRFKKIERVKRFCRVCCEEVVEDVRHFVFECSALKSVT